MLTSGSHRDNNRDDSFSFTRSLSNFPDRGLITVLSVSYRPHWTNEVLYSRIFLLNAICSYNEICHETVLFFLINFFVWFLDSKCFFSPKQRTAYWTLKSWWVFAFACTQKTNKSAYSNNWSTNIRNQCYHVSSCNSKPTAQCFNSIQENKTQGPLITRLYMSVVQTTAWGKQY